MNPAKKFSEDALTERLIRAMEAGLAKKYPPGRTKRFFHPKMHGCVRAEFIIPELPEPLCQGIFAKAGVYPAWIRFSSANPKIRDDRKKGFIGSGIKVNLSESADEVAEQDFLLVSKEALAAADLLTIVRTVEAITGNIFKKTAFGFRYFWRIIHSLITANLVCSIDGTSYWSQTPYQYGKDIVKFSIRPKSPVFLEPGDHPDFLRQRLQAHLNEQDLYFEFLVQFHTDPDMPLEDPSVKWKSPFHKVAEIRIPAQQFNNPERDAFGENLSFSPWHCTKSHVPLGMINRARKKAYDALSRYRHERNGVKTTFEPKENITEESPV